MGEQAQLFQPDPAIVPCQTPRSDQALAIRELSRHPEKYDKAFRAWISENWPVWNAFCRLARAVQESGRKRYSARTIFHILRFHSHVRQAVPLLHGVRLGGEYKLNNNASAHCARLFNAMDPENAGFFETRRPIK